MAKDDLSPLVKLTPEGRKELEDLEGAIKRSKRAIELMKEMDMDTSDLEKELARYDRIRTILLKEF